MKFTMEIHVVIIRLFLAILLSGLIGMERQNKNRPAGFKTHILVCLGSALTMMISQSILLSPGFTGSFDPTRLGAQVISGIGFLGAGTIIREGASVKGLTTAATLWAVACVGLAVGAGFYWGAIACAILIFIVLKVLGLLSFAMNEKSANLILHVTADNTPDKIGEICMLLSDYHVTIRNMEFITEDEDFENRRIQLKFVLNLPHKTTHTEVICAIASLEGVLSVEE